MKKIILTFMLSLAAFVVAVAQSSLAGYPAGAWQSSTEGKSRMLDIYITRIVEPQVDFGNMKSCGTLSIVNSNSDDVYYEGLVNYVGRGIDANNKATNVFYFTVESKSGKVSQVGMVKSANTNRSLGGLLKMKFVSVTGELASYPVMKEWCYSFNTGNGRVDQTPDALDDKELLEYMRDGLDIGSHMYGFGNVRQYINAHSKLIPGRAVYAKSKTGKTVYIRQSPNTNSPIIAFLPVGTTLYVQDEHNGWCQVMLSPKRYGWVSLSVVNLTNTPSATTTIQ